MDTSRSAAERIRPILQAMERSIDSARRQRTQTPGRADHGDQSHSANNTSGRATPPAVIGQVNNHSHNAPTAPSPSTPGRLKAKPKRASTFASPFDQPAYRSQAG